MHAAARDARRHSCSIISTLFEAQRVTSAPLRKHPEVRGAEKAASAERAPRLLLLQQI